MSFLFLGDVAFDVSIDALIDTFLEFLSENVAFDVSIDALDDTFLIMLIPENHHLTITFLT